MNHVMLDLETMGKNPGCPVMSIGACLFDPMTGEIGQTFHEQINLRYQPGLDSSTVIWWMKQSDDARSKFYDNERAADPIEVLARFSTWFSQVPNAQVWGNGSSFDCGILGALYRQWELEQPWKFWNERDVRTVVEMGQTVGFDPRHDMPFDGVRHDALADAIHQAKYVSVIYQLLLGGRNA